MTAGSLRTRNSERGAIFVEALVVVVFLSIFLAGGMFFHKLYAAKLKSLEDVRQTTWVAALKGCQTADLNGYWSTSGAGSAAKQAENEGELQLETMTTDSAESFVGAPMHITREPAVNVTADRLLGGRTFTLHSKVVVSCNEEPRKDSLKDLGGAVMDALPSFWRF